VPGTKGHSGGQGAKPTELKRKLGNPGMHKLPDESNLVILPSLASAPPEPTRPLGQAGRQAWDHAIGAGQAWLGESDIELLQSWAECIDDMGRWRLHALQNPDDLDSSQRLLEARKQMMSIAMELGLTPLARSRIRVAEVRVMEGVSRLIQPPDAASLTPIE
jgi:hypothetical protein